MNIYDYSKLRGKIVEKLGTINNLCKKIKISEPTIYSKFNCKTEFKQSDIIKICNVLEIPIEDISIYFFKYLVKKT